MEFARSFEVRKAAFSNIVQDHRRAIALWLTFLVIYHSLWLIDSVNNKFYNILNPIILRLSSSAGVTQTSWSDRPLKSWQRFHFNIFKSIKLLRLLVEKIIIITWVLLVFFRLASHQGIADARGDAVENVA